MLFGKYMYSTLNLKCKKLSLLKNSVCEVWLATPAMSAGNEHQLGNGNKLFAIISSSNGWK